MELSYYQSLEPFWGIWKITKMLGEGAYGKVFEIQRDDSTQLTSALKIITIPQSESEWQSLMANGMDEVSATSYFQGMVDEITTEILFMSKLTGHSNIVSYEDHSVIQHADKHGWDILIRMELLTPFLQMVPNDRSTDRDSVIKLGVDICKALEGCQTRKIIHRDIKPENIFVSSMGDYKLGDFGIARMVEKTSGALSKKGTYTYMAPEVYKGEEYGATVDIYSLGIVLYRLLNRNRAPFMPPYPQPIRHSDMEESLSRRYKGDKIPLPVDAQDELGQIVLKACAYDPADRYQNASEMRMALEALGKQPQNSSVTQSTDVAADKIAENEAADNKIVENKAAENKTAENKTAEKRNDQVEPSYVTREKPKGKTRLIIACTAVIALIVVAVVVIGGMNKGGTSETGLSRTDTTGGSNSQSVDGKGSEPAAAVKATKASEKMKILSDKEFAELYDSAEDKGHIAMQSLYILAGGEESVRYVDGQHILSYSPDMYWHSSDKSIAEITASPDGMESLLVGKKAGKVTIDVVYNGHRSSADFVILDTDNKMVELKDLKAKGASETDTIVLPHFGKAKTTLKICDFYSTYTGRDLGADSLMDEDHIRFYSSPEMFLDVEKKWENDELVLTISDAASGTSEGYITMFITNASYDKAVFALKIPVKLEGY